MDDDDEFDEEDEEVVMESDPGPASGGYGDGGFDEAEEEEEIAPDTTDEAMRARGVENRAFFDSMATGEDERKKGIRLGLNKRSLTLNELRQKMRRKEATLHQLKLKITTDESRIEHAEKKAYYATALEKGIVTEDPLYKDTKEILPEASMSDMSNEFSLLYLESDLKELLRQKSVLENELTVMKEKISEEERALAQIQRDLLRT